MRSRAVGKKFPVLLYHWTTGDSAFHTDDVSLRRSELYVWLVEAKICDQLNFCARSSDFIWRENQSCRCKILAVFSDYVVLKGLYFFYINSRLVIFSSALEISSQSGIIPARTFGKITATAYPSRRIAYKFKLSYELLSMFGMYAVVNPAPFFLFPCCAVLKDDVARDGSRQRFLAQNSVATLLRHCLE